MNGLQLKLSRFWQRLATPDWAWLPKINQDEQTRASWAKRIDSYDGLPPAYRAFFADREMEGRVFPYTVLVPACEGFLRRSPEKLVCGLGNGIAVLEKSGCTREGDYVTASLRFNAVSDYLLQPLVERMRRGAAEIEMGGEAVDASQLEGWARQSYKFMNYARRSLLLGERAVGAIFKPEILKPVVSVLGRIFYRTLAPAQAVILTERELVLIREEHRRGGGDRYGGMWDYVPLGKIESMSLSEREGELIGITIKLPENTRLDCLFQILKKDEIDKLMSYFYSKKKGSNE